MSSRVCVKELPFDCDDKMLRKHFSRCGTVTDAKVMYTANGKSRQFGFVGFKTNEGKEKALKMNGGYLRSNKIIVQQAYRPQDRNINRPWSKYSQGSSRFLVHRERVDKRREKKEKKRKMKKKKKIIPVEKNENEKHGEFKSYAEMHKKPIWDNDFDPSVRPPKPDSKSEDEPQQKDESEKFVDISETDKPSSVKNKGVSDLDYLQGKMVDSVDEFRKPMEIDPDEQPKRFKKKKKIELQEGRLFLRNLPFSVTEEDLEELFSPFGDLSEVYLPEDRHTHQKTGFGFVAFVIPSNANRAKRKLSGTYFQGRFLHIFDAHSKKSKFDDDSFGHIKSSYKRKKKIKEKKTAGSAFNWNTLYMQQNTAVSNIIEKKGKKKSDYLDVNSKNIPVKVALAETEAINQTKQQLSDEMGIDFTSVFHSEFNKTRSKTMILVKNIPINTTEEELKQLFGKFGRIKKVFVPDTGTMGVVEFNRVNAARAAFENLSYNSFKNSPLFLEWAPVGVKQRIERNEEDDEEEDEEDEEEENAGENGVLLVKNVAPGTRETELGELFLAFGHVKRCTINKEFNNAFVVFSSVNDSINAYKALQNHMLNGERIAIEYKWSEAKKNTEKRQRKRVDNKKLIVKNLAFEANRKDLKELFSKFGEIKEIRLPRKVSGGHRGFAFIEFVSAEDARNAKEKLGHTHLFGRSLVLEYSVDDDSVESVRTSVRNELIRKRKRDDKVKKMEAFRKAKRRKFLKKRK